VRLRLFLGMWAIVLLVVAATVLAVEVLDREDDGAPDGDPTVTLPGGAGEEGADDPGPETTEAPLTAELEVQGALTALHLPGAVLAPRELPAPLEVVAERGFGNGGTITGVVVNGHESTIVWDGGRPLVLSSGPGLVLDPVTVELTPEGLRLLLGGGVHALAPGSHRLDTPVAVGSRGIATPFDAVSLDATEAARFEAAGDASIVLDGPRTFTGPGPLTLEGALQVRDATGTRTVDQLALAEASYEITVQRDPAGTWTVVARLDDHATP